MDFGVVLQTNPPASRVGRSSPSWPRRTASATCGRSTRTCSGRSRTSSTARSWPRPATVDRRADGHQPGDPRLDRHRVALRHAQRDVRQPHHLRHRPRRLGGARHQRQADARWPSCASRSHVIRELANGAAGRVQRARRCGSRGASGSSSRSGSPRTGPRRSQLDRRGRRRLHPAARRPRHRRVDDRGGADGRGGRRPRPRRAQVLRRRARRTSATTWRAHARPVPLVRRHGRQPRRRHRRALRRRTARCPTALTDYIEGREGYDYNEHGRAGNTHTDFVPDEIVDRFCILGTAERAHREARASCATLGVDQFAVYLQHDNKEETLRVYGEHVIPALARARSAAKT